MAHAIEDFGKNMIGDNWLEPYERMVLSTKLYPRENTCAVLQYLSNGLLSEIGEFIEKFNSKEETIYELGDILWYITALCQELDSCLMETILNTHQCTSIIEFENMIAQQINKQSALMSLIITGSVIAGIIKKIYRDDGGRLSQRKKEYLLQQTGNVLWALTVVCRIVGVNLRIIAKRNGEKLLGRLNRNTIQGSGDTR